MLKKKAIAIWMMIVMVLSIVCHTTPMDALAAEQTNLKLAEEVFRSVEMVAGDNLHISLELMLKEGYCISPVFTITPEKPTNASPNFAAALLSL